MLVQIIVMSLWLLYQKQYSCYYLKQKQYKKKHINLFLLQAVYFWGLSAFPAASKSIGERVEGHVYFFWEAPKRAFELLFAKKLPCASYAPFRADVGPPSQAMPLHFRNNMLQQVFLQDLMWPDEVRDVR